VFFETLANLLFNNELSFWSDSQNAELDDLSSKFLRLLIRFHQVSLRSASTIPESMIDNLGIQQILGVR
jgi:hypothetical protein